ncbi:hypothetical protein [Streptomyces sp. NPDC015131]
MIEILGGILGLIFILSIMSPEARRFAGALLLIAAVLAVIGLLSD